MTTSSASRLDGAHVLVVEDDEMVADVVMRYMRRDGATVDLVPDGRAALAQLDRSTFDLVVLDLLLPGVHGLEVCSRLRAARETPVIMLTALGEEEHRILGLEIGADDYVTKPFSPAELVARANAVLRRSGGVEPAQPRLSAASIELDLIGRRGWREGAELVLTSLEFDLLVFLMRNPGRVFSREDLLRAVWGYEFGDTSTVTVHIRRLREKIEADPSSPRHVQTVWGVGYRFEPTEPISDHEDA